EIEGFPQEKAVLMKHMVLSHHGVLEYGSPKVPMTVEAVILSFIDDLDAKVEATQRYIKNDAGESNWTAYHRMMGRYLFKGFPSDDDGVADDNAAEAATNGNKKAELDLF
ncbi:MAG: HD family phosphohydrolase, partial [Proteobacteria bacterium]|nr:HD family phosphohydrolase [Pseudomonadota bacterium]